ncbi:hypothetical protein E2C01_090713 [Portunus trituberculatus]|uniref:Uncharacterized protein n=1 Tax=Portunus trituberculatus TaxID=210409 RepID=A0A5B7JQV1_PORTR|nr:hypothetical protein [Portunus trituberculatus]
MEAEKGIRPKKEKKKVKKERGNERIRSEGGTRSDKEAKKENKHSQLEKAAEQYTAPYEYLEYYLTL